MLAMVFTTLQASAAMYIVGHDPFGGWSLSNAAQMIPSEIDYETYTYSNIIDGTVYFVFGEELSDDWTTFNDNYRYGPSEVDGNGNQEVTADTWVTASKSNEGAFIFTGDGSNYIITFDKLNMFFKIQKGYYSFEEDGIYYLKMSYNTVHVTSGSTFGGSYEGDVTIPSKVTHDGVTYHVTAIGDHAFLSCHNLTSINIPTSVTSIEDGAFYYCTSLTHAVIPESVETIGNWNFYMSEELTTVILPRYLKSMGVYCFADCRKLSKVTCKAPTPPTLSTGCFTATNPPNLTLYVPAGSVSAYQADNEWNQLFNSITAMPDYDFNYFNLKFDITGGTTAKVVGCTATPDNAPGTWRIPDEAPYDGVTYRVTAVGYGAFEDYYKISRLIIGNNVKDIGPYAFYGCKALTSLNLGNVEIIAGSSFGNTTSLTTVSLPNTLWCINEYAFEHSGLTSVTIPASVTLIDNNPFVDCQSLTGISVSSSNEKFTSVNGVLFNKSMTKLIAYPDGNTASSYTVPEGVTQIGGSAFGYANNLQRVTLPSSLTEVSHLAFSDCQSLTKVTCLAQTPPDVFENPFISTIENSDLKLIVPKGCRAAYQTADVWKDFPSIKEMYCDFYEDGIYYNITGPNTVEVSCETEAGGSYSDCYSGIVNIPETVTHDGVTYTVTAIGSGAFAYCYDLTAVNIPATVTEIKYTAFFSDFNLTTVNLPEHLTKIGIYAFYYCTNLRNVSIPASVTTLDIYAFCGCSSLTEVTVPSSVTTIGYGAFMDCSNLTKVTLGSGLTSIGSSCFYNCPNITEVICLAVLPPEISDSDDEPNFPASVYQNAVLRVPHNSYSHYRNHAVWGKFANIVGDQNTGGGIPGDVNGDNMVNLRDLTILINFLLTGGTPPLDVNGDNMVNIKDVSDLINILLTGGGN